MDDTAVSASLVLRKILLLFQDEDARLGMLIAHGHSRRQSHDSTSDDYMLMHSSGRRKLAGLFEFRNGIGGDVLNTASTLIQRFHFLGIDAQSHHLHTRARKLERQGKTDLPKTDDTESAQFSSDHSS